ncbi:Uncharacterised protein [Mycobacteroides abscessus subsp. massiliense]|nr:Uncharacterised protein [Mycobacteroides abscessus subsp. massiliense]
MVAVERLGLPKCEGTAELAQEDESHRALGPQLLKLMQVVTIIE